jgi:hypothetical protein
MSSYQRNETRATNMIPASIYYLSYQQYEKSDFGFMKFNPPVSPPIHYPYMRKFDQTVRYQPSYNTLIHTSPEFPNNNPDYSSISNAYTTCKSTGNKKENKEKKDKEEKKDE